MYYPHQNIIKLNNNFRLTYKAENTNKQVLWYIDVKHTVTTTKGLETTVIYSL